MYTIYDTLQYDVIVMIQIYYFTMLSNTLFQYIILNTKFK
jgi:hypothetical protein